MPRRFIPALFVVFTLSLFAPPAGAQDEPPLEKLFNGQDLAGWRGDLSLWSVEDGAITGRTTADAPIEQNTFLIWEGEPLKDFELALEFRIVGGNSGIQYRSEVLDEDKWVVGGYQADMEAGAQYTGILYEERGRGILALRGQRVVIDDDGQRDAKRFAEVDELQKVIRREGWNNYTIRAQGADLRHVINGTLMSETIDNDAEEKSSSGVLALQLHRGPPMTVQFRNIRLQRLKESAPVSPASVATPAESLSLLPGFQAELVYSVPRESQGSWVSMTVDPRGRLIVSDQYGGLFRITPPPSTNANESARIERLAVSLGHAHGLLCANDSLYAVVNGSRSDNALSGLYRARDTDGDDEYDEVKLLRRLRGEGEHGPHSVILAPDGESLYVVGGNHTRIPEPEQSRVPRVWDEDQLLPRMWDAGGHAVGVLAPGGWICRTDLDGNQWELISNGYRNAFDIAFNRAGELFTFDADMEWDIGAPWYRPTRICHVTSGSEFGWRSGTGKWPDYYPDSLPGAVDMGPSSPTGITFGYGARFPAKYRQALFVCDWSFGKLYAIHLKPRGATYGGAFEEFVTGAPLPLTDIVVNPHDGAMYFTIGGRNTQSGLYRITYCEPLPEPDLELTPEDPNDASTARRAMETWHGRESDAAVVGAWPYLNHADRFVRYAARVAIEWQPIERWQQRALTEKRPGAEIQLAVALARHGDKEDSDLSRKIVAMLRQLPWESLTREQQLGLLRAYGLVVTRFASTDETSRAEIMAHCDDHFPNVDVDLNRELSALLAFLNAAGIVERTLDLQDHAATQEEQIHYAYTLRPRIADASLEQQRRYFAWYASAGGFRGGHSLLGFLDNFKEDALKRISDERLEDLAEVLRESTVPRDMALQMPSGPIQKEYTVDDVVQLWSNRSNPYDVAQGRQLFARALCFRCHRMGSEGGATGPDLTALGRRFSIRDLAEAVVEPDKVISDQYRATNFVLNSGRVVTGRVANLAGETLMVVTNMLAPGDYTNVRRKNVEEMFPSKTSEMPAGLLDTLTEDEIRQLLAFLISGGDSGHNVYGP